MPIYSRSFCRVYYLLILFLFFFNDTATTEIYTLSLHDALPISPQMQDGTRLRPIAAVMEHCANQDRKSTRLNSSHRTNSYAVFCLKKKKTEINNTQRKKKKEDIIKNDITRPR